RDVLIGGLGLDRFKLNFTTESPPGVTRDVITDFDGKATALGDMIDLSVIDADISLPGNQQFHWIGGAAFSTNATAELRYANGILQGSTDSDAAAEFEIRLVGGPSLSVGGPGSDIVL